MRVFLVDDEPLAAARLERLLEATGRVQIVGSASDPVQALERLRAALVDALFLDVEMPALNGFELLARLATPPLVVFTTAYDRYALRAFEVSSIDFLLKPVEPEALDRALGKLERMLAGSEPRTDLSAIVARLTRALAQPQPDYVARLASRLGERVELVEVHQVTHFYARDKLTYAATPARHFVVDPSITELEARLDPRRFFRIHRSTLVNVDCVKEIYNWIGGAVVVKLRDGKTELAVARDRVADLKRRLGV